MIIYKYKLLLFFLLLTFSICLLFSIGAIWGCQCCFSGQYGIVVFWYFAAFTNHDIIVYVIMRVFSEGLAASPGGSKGQDVKGFIHWLPLQCSALIQNIFTRFSVHLLFQRSKCLTFTCYIFINPRCKFKTLSSIRILGLYLYTSSVVEITTTLRWS